MSDPGGSWQFDDERWWHRATPPSGWIPSRDDGGHALDRTPERTEELAVLVAPWPDPPPAMPPTQAMAALPGHRLTDGGDRSGGARPHGPSGSGWSSRLAPWMKVAVPALVAAIAMLTAGVALTRREPDVAAPRGGPSITSPGTVTAPASPGPDGGSAGRSTGAAPATEPSTPPESTGSTPTTAPPRTTTPDPATPPPSDPLAACSTGQRNVIERGNHSWDWYLDRFDPDGDGVLCA